MRQDELAAGHTTLGERPRRRAYRLRPRVRRSSGQPPYDYGWLRSSRGGWGAEPAAFGSPQLERAPAWISHHHAEEPVQLIAFALWTRPWWRADQDRFGSGERQSVVARRTASLPEALHRRRSATRLGRAMAQGLPEIKPWRSEKRPRSSCDAPMRSDHQPAHGVGRTPIVETTARHRMSLISRLPLAP